MSDAAHLFHYESPLGPIELELAGDVCYRITLEATRAPECSPDHPIALWLRAYFFGKQMPLPEIAPARTAFQMQLREALLKIPAGETRTYGDLANS